MPGVTKLIKAGVALTFLIALVAMFFAERFGLNWLFAASVIAAISSGVGGMLFFMAGIASGAYSTPHPFQDDDAKSAERVSYHIAGSDFVGGSDFGGGDAGGGGD